MGFAEVSKMETSSIHSIESFCITAMSRLPDRGRLCWDICTPPPEGSWPFSAPRALPGRPRDVERSSRPEGGLEVPEGLKMARSPRAEVYKSHSYTFEHTF